MAGIEPIQITECQSGASASEEERRSVAVLSALPSDFHSEAEAEAPLSALTPASPLWENAGFWSHLDSFIKVQNSAHTRRAYEADLVDFLTFLKATGKAM